MNNKYKKVGFSKIICISLAALAGVAIVGCSQSESSSSGASSQTDAGSTPGEASSASESSNSGAAVSGEFDLESLRSVNTDSDDKMAGIWKITSGVGSNYESFYYMFDGDGTSALITGTSGYVSEYSYETDDSGKNTITVKLVFGLSGSYTYEFSGSDSVTLTSTEDSDDVSVLTKVDDADFVPDGSADAQIDKDLVGCWLSGNGDYLCFDSNGVMYHNLYGSMFTYSTYTAADGEIKSAYTTGNEPTERTAAYSVSGDTLTFDDVEYTRINFDEMQ